jgi:murein DD-endopeptidase MepM/ murein hydrolase activator NlpD
MRCILGVALALLLTFPAAAADTAGTSAKRTATVRGIPAQPGSVLEITLDGVDGDADPQGTAFDRPLVFMPAGAPHTWRTLVGIDVGQAPSTTGTFRIDVAAAAGRELAATGTIAVTPRAFATRRLRVASQFVDPSPQEFERIRTEAERLEAIFATVTQSERIDTFVAPLPGPASNFGSRSIFNGEARAPHAGADFRGAAGTPIPAPAAGRVVLAEDLFFTGHSVVIDHGLGLYSLLAHLSRIDVAPGQAVSRGDIVGLLGATGRVTGPHLHWSVRLNGARVDPLSLIAATSNGER